MGFAWINCAIYKALKLAKSRSPNLLAISLCLFFVSVYEAVKALNSITDAKEAVYKAHSQYEANLRKAEEAMQRLNFKF